MTKRSVSAFRILVTCLIGFGILAPLGAQSQAPTTSTAPEFDVASVKLLPRIAAPGQADLSFVGKSGKLFAVAGNRVTITGTLRTLISAAYAVRDYQVTGMPNWGDSVMYAITAKTAGDGIPTQEQVRPMFQSLLADRFQLKLHRQPKEIQVYHLSISKAMPAFKPAAPEETFSWKLTQDPDKMVRSKATQESVGDFVQLVGASADRPVIDKTGVTGFIDYEIVFSEQDTQNRDDINIRILDAVKKQLGMKLEPAKDEIEVLVIDQVEHPSAN